MSKLRIDIAITIEVPGNLDAEETLEAGWSWARINLPMTDALDWSTQEVELSDHGYLP